MTRTELIVNCGYLFANGCLEFLFVAAIFPFRCVVPVGNLPKLVDFS